MQWLQNIRYCWNPNITTTQPYLNLVGFDTIITLHTPPHQELYFYKKEWSYESEIL